MSFAKIALVTALFGVSSLLQGCGCDQDKATKCLNALSVTDKAACGKFSGCYKDSNCCDLEEQGTKIKDLTKTMCAITVVSGDTSKDACA
jgi:hypothetical protein